MNTKNPAVSPLPAVGVSACLLGHEVRHDGGHCRDRYLNEGLGRHVHWVPVCPEMEMGLDSPRATLQIRRQGQEHRLVQPKSGHDYTEAMEHCGARLVEFLLRKKVRGFVLKSRSPSCGLERVRVHGSKGQSRDGVGLFAKALRKALPLLPLEEAGRLNDPDLRERFLEKVFAYDRWCRYREEDGSKAGLLGFHSRHKIQCMAHDPAKTKALGQLAARAGDQNTGLQDLLLRYGTQFMDILGKPANKGRHVNAMEHLQGFIKNSLDREDKLELKALFESYRKGWLTRREPLLLLKHHLRKSGNPWPLSQYYLQPYPLGLDRAKGRNH